MIIRNIEPYVPSDQINLNGAGNIGTIQNRFSQINVNTINATTANISGNIVGNLEGTASRAQSLSTPISLNFAGGDVSGTTGDFDGRTTISNIELFVSNGFISNKPRITNVLDTDEILVNKVDTSDGTETGIYKITKSNFLKTVPTIPVGTIMPYGGYTPPLGWLICDGSVVNKVDYNRLWQVIQYNFRDPTLLPDNGVSTFALPDARGRGLVGLDSMGNQGAAGRNVDALDIGNTGGSTETVIDEENLPEHEHTLKGKDENESQYYTIRVGSSDIAPDESIPLGYETGDFGSHGLNSSGGIKTDKTLGVPLDIMNPFLAVTYIIYAGE
jgi:microcystin-dependent protein